MYWQIRCAVSGVVWPAVKAGLSTGMLCSLWSIVAWCQSSTARGRVAARPVCLRCQHWRYTGLRQRHRFGTNRAPVVG